MSNGVSQDLAIAIAEVVVHMQCVIPKIAKLHDPIIDIVYGSIT